MTNSRGGSAGLSVAPNPLAAVILPPYNSLSQAQTRGMTCVWDGVALTPGTAVDLGPRTFKRLGEPTAWFPRACKPCAQQQAMDTLMQHTQTCEQCVDDHTQCPTGLGLVRLVREARR
ncbi:hypothetical protein [Streptomyces sp. NPDC002520]